MKKLSASLVSFIATQFPDFTGKVKLIRALGLICNGAYILGKYGVLMQADLNDNTNLWALLGWYDSNKMSPMKSNSSGKEMRSLI
ncbi:hypothetical protein GKODMF_06655 [Candidatus Electrothrix gigas]